MQSSPGRGRRRGLTWRRSMSVRGQGLFSWNGPVLSAPAHHLAVDDVDAAFLLRLALPAAGAGVLASAHGRGAGVAADGGIAALFAEAAAVGAMINARINFSWMKDKTYVEKTEKKLVHILEEVKRTRDQAVSYTLEQLG